MCLEKRCTHFESTLFAGRGSMTPRYGISYIDMFDYPSSERGPDYESAELALQHAWRVIDQSLQELMEPGMGAPELYKQFMTFGEDVAIAAIDGAPELHFDGQAYARRRSEELCNEPRGAG